MILRLPLPPPPNAWPKNPYSLHTAKNAYRQQAWVRAITTEKPLHDPPPQVILHAMHLIRSKRYFRDDDNLRGGLKWAIDTLTLKQTGKLHWKQGLYEVCGYLIDDGPQYMKLGDVWQERCSPDLEQLVLEIEPSTWDI